jgi:5-methyltetrahydropteroyltriglutamate--homocysteine methyltransferase
VWKDVTLPAGKVLMPGLIVHPTNVVEHPDLVAERLLRYAHSSAATASWLAQIAVLAKPARWLRARFHHVAKLKSLAEGAAIASKLLWH